MFLPKVSKIMWTQFERVVVLIQKGKMQLTLAKLQLSIKNSKTFWKKISQKNISMQIERSPMVKKCFVGEKKAIGKCKCLDKEFDQ